MNSLKSMKRAIDSVLSYSPEELGRLLFQAWANLNEPPSLSAIYSEGLSNVNIMGSTGDLTFVLKLPWTSSHSTGNPYEQLFQVTEYVSGFDLAPRPLATGQLPSPVRTPFIVFEHLEGFVHASVCDLTTDQKRALSTAHKRLGNLKPPGVPVYQTPNDYVDSIFARTASCVQFHRSLASWTRSHLDDFADLREAVAATSDHVEDWPSQFMHGDLHEGNIVFLGSEVCFLDFEHSAYGAPLLDLAYLRVQHLPSHPPDAMMHIVEDVDTKVLETYEPLALIFAVAWTLEHLAYLDSGLVEPTLMVNYSQAAMRNYVEIKMKELKGHLF